MALLRPLVEMVFPSLVQGLVLGRQLMAGRVMFRFPSPAERLLLLGGCVQRESVVVRMLQVGSSTSPAERLLQRLFQMVSTVVQESVVAEMQQDGRQLPFGELQM